ncbi:hypothetical protein B0H16DRAFT_1885794 [Mycena metata]|uniref:F-box domain-containing protein n=1 Tax=Mycena metata TaxID=1033252 RepID=A0AAD7J8X5_9AGAR|nr:hypothetical protein B0H16DRAFT_1885794 [Mycena metata]
MISLDPWVQSLRTDPSHTLRRSRPGASDVARRYSVAPAPNVRRRAPLPSGTDDDATTSKRKNSDTTAVLKSARRRHSGKEPTIEPPGKCSNICCDYLSRNLAQSYSKTMSMLRMDHRVHPQEATQLRNQISRAQVEYESYQKEILRLNRVLAACPPPGRLSTVSVNVRPQFCMHACCDSSLRPPRGSTEMLRLRRITQHLQFRSRELLQYLNAKRCLLSPIRRLPPELLHMVFAFVVSIDRTTPFVSISLAAIRLAHVCSFWRTLALNTSELWATINIRHAKPQHRLAQLEFYSSQTACALSVGCTLPSRKLLTKINRLSYRWWDLILTIADDDFELLNVVRHKIPLLRSLDIHNRSHRDGAQTSDTFQDAPSLQYVTLTADSGHIWPFSYILPWQQIVWLILNPISLSVFSECLRNCPKLLYFEACLVARPGEVVPEMAELRSPLHKLVLTGSACQQVVIAHSFPNMLSLSVDMDGLHPDFFAFLLRSSRLEMLALRAWPEITTADLLALLLATPSLRIVHFRDFHWAAVTPRFDLPLITPAQDDPFEPVEPRSLAELVSMGGITGVEDAALLANIRTRMEHSPSFDPYCVEIGRLQIENVPFSPEWELDYLVF